MRILFLLALWAAVSSLGCGKYQAAPPPPAPGVSQAVPPAAAQPAGPSPSAAQSVAPSPGQPPSSALPKGQPQSSPPPATATPAAGVPAAGVQRVAGVGVGEKGRGYGAGLIATPAAAYFAAREKIVFQIQVPDAVSKYKGLHGNAPQSHEEFMKLLQEWQIHLPQLPAGHRYLYKPDEERLYVEIPQ